MKKKYRIISMSFSFWSTISSSIYITLLSFNVHAQLSDLYANISQKTYEAFNGECLSLTKQDYISSGFCKENLNIQKHSLSSLEEVAESIFFSAEANAEVERLTCSISKADVISKNKEMKNRVLNDMAIKIQAGADIYKALGPARAALFQQRQKTNFLRPSGIQMPTNKIFNTESAKLAEMEKEVQQLEGVLSGLIASTWNGGTKAISNEMMRVIKGRETDLDKIRSTLAINLDQTLESVKNELNSNKEVLLSEKSPSPRCRGCWNLSNNTKRELFMRAQQNNSIAKKFSDSENLSRGLECRLEGKYGKGQDYVDNILFAGSLIGSGGAALLTKAPQILKVTLAAGTKAGRITTHASKVFLYSSLGITSTSMISQIDKKCLASHPSGYVRKNVCSGSQQELINSEIQALDEGNCILSLLMTGAPLPILVGVNKALKGLNLNPSKFVDSIAAKGSAKFENLSKGYGRAVTVTKDDIRKLDEDVRNFVSSNGGQVEVVGRQMVKNPEIAASARRVEQLKKSIEDVKNGTEPTFKIYNSSANKKIEKAKLRLEDAKERLKEVELAKSHKSTELEKQKVAAAESHQNNVTSYKEEFEKRVNSLKEKSEAKIRDLELKQAEAKSKGIDAKRYEESIEQERNDLREALAREEKIFINRVDSSEKIANRQFQSIEERALERSQDEIKRAQEKVSKIEADLTTLQNDQSSLANIRIKEIEAKIEREQISVQNLPEMTEEKGIIMSNFASGLYRGQIKLKDGSPSIDQGNGFSLYRITKLPANKGRRSFDTPAILHPDMERDLAKLKDLGVEVRLDPTLGIDSTAAFFLSAPGRNKVLHIKPDTPYHYFKHEAQHAEFDFLIEPKLGQAKIAVVEGKSLQSVFNEKEITAFGKDKMDRLESLLRRQNTDLAVNETMAVDAQIAQMGFVKVPSPTVVNNEKYALWHQIVGYQAIMSKGPMNALQTAEYNRAISRLGVMLSYLDGTKEAQKFVQTVATPSKLSVLSIVNRLQNIKPEEIKNTPILYDNNGNLIFQKQDGSWEKIRFNGEN